MARQTDRLTNQPNYLWSSSVEQLAGCCCQECT